MLADRVASVIIGAAKAHDIDPPALLALVEVETGGRAFETDGRTPQLLYERHKAYEQAKLISPQVLARFVGAGLAHKGWRPASQYRDQRTSQQRLALIAKARTIHEEVADRSASWGLGQTMGFLAEELGFASAREMVGCLGTIDGQVDCMIREVARSHLIAPLNAQDWAHVARIYNGAGYRANRYDEKLAEAFKRCSRLASIELNIVNVGPEHSLSPDDIRRVQRRLDELGYHGVGAIDGRWGPSTTGALAAFQAHEGLTHDGHFTPETAAALDAAEPKTPDRERAVATVGDVRESGSVTMRHADNVGLCGAVKVALGGAGAATASAQQFGLLDAAKGAAERASEWRDVFNSLGDLGGWVLAHWWLFAIVAGVSTLILAERIRAVRLADHQSGRHNGHGD
jgi:hypothetical protein